MKNRTHFYTSNRNVLVWLMTLCMVASAVTRIVFVGVKGADVWSQIVLPVVAVLLYALIVLIAGKEQFYKTAIPVWMISIYYACWFFAFPFSSFDKLIGVLFAVVLLFIAVFYTNITSGKLAMTTLLVPLALAPYAAVLYLNRAALLSGRVELLLPLLPDGLMTLGLVLVVFALQIHPVDEYHPTWGDRGDGRRIRTLDPMNQVSPYIMKTRNTSSNTFSESFEITNIERFIRQKRREDMPNLGLMHVLLACYCRAMSKYPGLNRFVSGQKIYTHGDDIQFCLTVKKEMSTEGSETEIKLHLTPADTLYDVYNKMNAAIEEVKNTPLNNDFDKTAHLLTLIPGVLLKFTVWLLELLDYFGMLPKFLLEVSPFHGSVFFTSMGSLGIPPIYHHLYDFGNLPMFASFGCKRRALEVQEDGSIVQKKYLDCKFTMDERIVDGFYYAAFFKYYRRILQHPDMLLTPPEKVERDID